MNFCGLPPGPPGPGTRAAVLGVPWAEIPTRLGRALRRRFERWQRHGVWAALFEASIPSAPAEGTVMVDSTTLKAHRAASGARGSRGDPAAQMLGRSRGGLCTKLHAVTDAAGRFLALCLSPGQAGDAAHRRGDGRALGGGRPCLSGASS